MWKHLESYWFLHSVIFKKISYTSGRYAKVLNGLAILMYLEIPQSYTTADDLEIRWSRTSSWSSIWNVFFNLSTPTMALIVAACTLTVLNKCTVQYIHLPYVLLDVATENALKTVRAEAKWWSQFNRFDLSWIILHFEPVPHCVYYAYHKPRKDHSLRGYHSFFSSLQDSATSFLRSWNSCPKLSKLSSVQHRHSSYSSHCHVDSAEQMDAG